MKEVSEMRLWKVRKSEGLLKGTMGCSWKVPQDRDGCLNRRQVDALGGRCVMAPLQVGEKMAGNTRVIMYHPPPPVHKYRLSQHRDPV